MLQNTQKIPQASRKAKRLQLFAYSRSVTRTMLPMQPSATATKLRARLRIVPITLVLNLNCES